MGDGGQGLIGEPEMVGEPLPERAAEVLSAGEPGEPRERPAWSRGLARRPWVWAVGGVVAASAVWAGTLQAVDYGHTAAPDLHGFHLDGNSPCTTANLEPLTDKLSSGGFLTCSPSVRMGPALDDTSCAATSSLPIEGDWVTSYVLTVTVELHKKTDPRAEFQGTYNPVISLATIETVNGYIAVPDQDAVTTVYPDLGDLAYLTSGKSHQALSVLYGGVVLSLTVDARPFWAGAGNPPTTADGSIQDPGPADTTALRQFLPGTMRHLMSVLSR
jgi:hypothetical protein